MSEVKVTLRLLEEVARTLEEPPARGGDRAVSDGLDMPVRPSSGETASGALRPATPISSASLLSALASADFDLYRAAVEVARGD